MRPIVAALLLAALASSALGQVAGQEADRSGLTLSEVVMELDRGGDAFFQVNYTLDSFTRLYVLILGCSHIEPQLRQIFKSYDDVEIKSADPEGATLKMRAAGRKNGGYILYDSRPLSAKVPRLTVGYPDSKNTDTFYNVSATPDVFCKA